MKQFLDRLSYLFHRPRYFGKKVLAVVTGGGMFKDIYAYLRNVTKAWGCDFVTGVGVPHLKGLTPGFRARVLRDLDRGVRAFYDALMQGKPRRPGTGDLMWFAMWKNAALAYRNPPDLKYWEEKGWLSAPYYYPVSTNPLVLGAIGLASKLVRSFMRKMYLESQ